MTRRYFFALQAGIAICTVTLPVHAYLDPGNGSMLLQLIIGGAAGLGVAVKYYWRQIHGVVFRPAKPRQDRDDG